MSNLGLMAFFCGVACVAGLLSFAFYQSKSNDGGNYIQREFHDECVKLSGKVVWNGKHWECLK